MTKLSDRAGYFARTAAGFRDLLRTRPLPNPMELIRARLVRREEHFLKLARDVVWAAPANPYREMLRLADCSEHDLEKAVRSDGIEATLERLRREGVYLTHDEFKLRAPIVRSNRRIEAHAGSFVNPLTRGGVAGPSGGSRSKGTLVRSSTQARLYREAQDALAVQEFGLERRRHLVLKPILPAIDGLFNLASLGRLGCALDRWYSPLAPALDSTHYRFATWTVAAMAQMHGLRMPLPRSLPLNDFSPVARRIAELQSAGAASALTSYASPASRVAAAALDLNLRLDGAIFLTGGETLTPGKRRTIESAGAAVYPRYTITEFGAIGHGCSQIRSGDCVHLFSDSIAAITHARPAPHSGHPVSSLMFTSLAEHAPYFLINAEMDDCGVLDRAECDCAYSRIGFTRLIRDISSFGKLTGHGMTLVGTDIVRILEEVLPVRFGGSATDYQLVEGEASGQTNLTLRVSRRVNVASLDEVRSCFLREMRVYFGGETASRLLRDSRAVQVLHEDPIATGRGKILSLHLLGPGQ